MNPITIILFIIGFAIGLGIASMIDNYIKNKKIRNK